MLDTILKIKGINEDTKNKLLENTLSNIRAAKKIAKYIYNTGIGLKE